VSPWSALWWVPLEGSSGAGLLIGVAWSKSPGEVLWRGSLRGVSQRSQDEEVPWRCPVDGVPSMCPLDLPSGAVPLEEFPWRGSNRGSSGGSPL
jgi:hypothetical protein